MFCGRHGEFSAWGQMSESDAPQPCPDCEQPAPRALAHPAVVSCVAGAQGPQQLAQNVRWFETAIPAGFWTALQARGLIDARAPVPPQ